MSLKKCHLMARNTQQNSPSLIDDLTSKMTTEALATQEVNDEYNSGVRECREYGSPLEKINGCDWTQCENCKRAYCFLCGTQMSSENKSCTSHNCSLANFIAWQVKRRTRTEPTPQGGSGQRRVTVTTFSGTHITLMVGINDTVDRFKQLIAQKTGIPDYQQLLAYSWKQLSNGFRVCQYNIRNQSIVQLMTQVDGG
jgi:hypothetical protein